jgi:hypothetical protein
MPADNRARWNTPGLYWGMPGLRYGGPNPLTQNKPMQQNLISKNMTQAEEDAILLKYDELLALLEPHTAVIPEDRRDNLVRLGPNRRAYDEKADNYMHQKPHLVPEEISVPEYDKDGVQIGRWRRIQAKDDAVKQRITDTMGLLGSDRMAANNLFKNACLFAIRLGKLDAKTVYEELAALYGVGRSGGRPANPPNP